MPELKAFQQERILSRRLFVALATPLAILLTMATVLGLQLSRLNRDARWVDHSDEVLAKLLDVQRQIIDQETGMRGFLLKDDPVFLEPYRSSHPLEALNELRLLVADNPAQVGHVDALRTRYQAWHEGVTPFLADRERAGAAMFDSLLDRKVQKGRCSPRGRAWSAAPPPAGSSST